MLELEAFVFNPFQENTFVLVNQITNEAIIFDPGCSDASERAELDNFLAGKKPVAILNTHAHLDHVLGVNHLVHKYKIPFYLHVLDEPLLRALPATCRQYGLGDVPPIDHYEPLSLGKLVMAGIEMEVIHCPGHAPGHVVFYLPQQKMIIGGDVLFKESIGRTDFPYCSFQDLEQSIKTKLYTLPEDVVILPGHGPETTIGHEKRYNSFVRA